MLGGEGGGWWQGGKSLTVLLVPRVGWKSPLYHVLLVLAEGSMQKEAVLLVGHRKGAADSPALVPTTGQTPRGWRV